MFLEAASCSLALLLLFINAVLVMAHTPLARSAFQQRSLSVRTVNETTPVIATDYSNKGNGNFEDTNIVLPIQNSTFNATSLLANDASVPGGRRLIETSESTNHGFLTSNCDARTLGSINAMAFDSMLAQIQSNLRIVISQAKKGPRSKYGFQSLFKSRANSGKVASIFAQIMNGDDANNDPEQSPIKPLTICVGPQLNVQGATGMEQLYENCQTKTTLLAVQPRKSNIVLLCPSFWQLPRVPPRSLCPERDPRGVMAPNKEWLQLNQQAVFVHEMVHMYLGREYATEDETYRIADAVALSEEESLKNPGNYAFFYAAVIAGCKKWPFAPARKGGDDGGL